MGEKETVIAVKTVSIVKILKIIFLPALNR